MYQNQLGTAQSTAYPVGQAERMATPMDDIRQGLSEAIMRADSLAERLYSIEQRLTGGVPMNKETPATPRPVPSGHTGALQQSLQDLHERINGIDQIVGRLGSAI